jgi:8-oxo-dGTP pyrophosphatase MutT (NUDIX family)
MVAMNDELDDLHRSELKKTGFYGKAGAGCLIVCRATGRVCLPLRSRLVEQPFTFGTWGGALDPGEAPLDAVKRELREEAGYEGDAEIVPAYVFESRSGFRYSNFVAIVEDEFEPELNWETLAFRWCRLDQILIDGLPLHFGLQALLDDDASFRLIESLCDAARLA